MAHPRGLLFEQPDEEFADDFAFSFRVADPLKAGKITSAGVDGSQVNSERFFESCLHLPDFPFAQQTGIDEDGRELGADRFLH